ncbi:GNAT family N-acetyltransferase [Kineosporia mesophila]|uniref:GNAT family N-acetyltransferase n=1 Tax=Kineosporia mesophila TaxID=566012 RepID=A0ABP6Z2I4_9ACTN|nr:GNAT family N-acetyltransferase [Kineosporia mesophila]MCD5351198.1 GNAT family N-acetyltransferase [Kineosporia mesophila]
MTTVRPAPASGDPTSGDTAHPLAQVAPRPPGTPCAPGDHDVHPLDNPAWASLTGPHAHFAESVGRARRYPRDVSPFVAVPTAPDAEIWRDLAELAGPGEIVALSGSPALAGTLPAGWEIAMQGEGVQLTATDDLVTAPDEEAVRLGEADVAEMLDLVARTRPGPFEPRTYQLGTYLGIRRGGVLVAMAGERLHPPGWTEISAVCTDPAHRGQGLGTRLVRAVAHGIRERGDTPLMHAAASNENAIRLYRSLGFTLRRRTGFFGLRTPD